MTARKVPVLKKRGKKIQRERERVRKREGGRGDGKTNETW